MAEPVVALQMYTLRNEAAEDYPGTLKKVAEMGYKAVQVSGTHSFGAAEIRKVMDDLGLGSAGTHVGLGAFEEDFDKAVEIVKTLGTEYAILPSVPKDRRGTAEDWRTMGKVMSELGAKLKEVGLRLGYHNHSFEFETFDGRTGYDLMMETADPELVLTEIDTYWAQHGGQDPVAMLKRFAGRIQVVHFKDMGEGDEKPMVPVGEGILDWPGIVEACKSGGTEWMGIEQDHCAPLEPLEAARVSLENCRKWGLA